MIAQINLNGNEYTITYCEDKFGACVGFSGKMRYMKVKPHSINCYKLLKTLVYAYRGAQGAYHWLVLSSHYQSNMDLAEKFVQHVIANGRGIR